MGPAQANIDCVEITLPPASFLISVPHNANEVLTDEVPLWMPNIKLLSPEQAHRLPAGAGRLALSNVRSFEVHDVGNVICANVFVDISTTKTKKQTFKQGDSKFLINSSFKF